MSSLRIVFAGTPEFAARHLEAVLQSSHQIVAVYTQPDRPAGRGKKLLASAVKQLALQHELPVLQPDSLKPVAEQDRLASHNADLMVVVAYGLLLPAPVLAIPRYGCINVHASLLPRWRGAAPIERAMLAGDVETGVTIMQMEAGLDTGPMIHKSAVKIAPHDTRLSLEAKLVKAGTAALLHVLDNLQTLQPAAETQNDALSTYAAKLEKQEAIINWSNPATKIDLQVRAGIGRNPACTNLDDSRIRILASEPHERSYKAAPGTIVEIAADSLLVACGTGSLSVSEVQLAGKNPVSVRALLNSHRDFFAPGKIFSSADGKP